MIRFPHKVCRHIFLLYGLVVYINHPLVAQNHYGAAWIVGYSNDSTFLPKYGKTELNFSRGNIDVNYKFGEKLPYLGFTNASVAHEDGTLRYFTDGFRIYNEKQKVIQNGDSINYGRIWRDYSPIYPTGFNHYFIPFPGKEKTQTALLNFSVYYYPDFIKRYTYIPYFKYSLINFDSITQKDFVSIKDSIISEGDFIETHMALTKHANGRDWWIIIEDYLSNNHRVYLLDTSGIRLYANQKIGVPADSFDWTGNSIFTPNGEMFIKYLRGYQIQIFDFDRCSGILSNPRIVINEPALIKDACYLSISPNNQFLYLNSDSIIWQYDLYAKNIKSSETLIGEWDGYFFENNLTTAFFQNSLALDGKIYLSCRSSSIYLHVINNPNEKGLNCNFQLRQVELPAFMYGSLPKPPNYNLFALKRSTCDTLLANVNNNFNDEISIYPNPVNHYFKIVSNLSSDLKVRIVDLMGTVVKEYQNNYFNYYDVTYIPAGIYFIHIRVKHRDYLKKIIIQY
jgi:hypothetical protein